MLKYTVDFLSCVLFIFRGNPLHYFRQPCLEFILTCKNKH
jgi:hypothetical protein